MTSLASLIESAVAYDGLPLSSGASHGLGRISARGALARWLHFLATCTVAAPIDAYFDLPHTPQLTVDPAVAAAIDRVFPKVPARHGHHVPEDRWDEALSLFESLEPLPVNPWGMAPVWLRFTTNFQLRSPGGGVWPGQDPELFGNFQTPGGIWLGMSSTRLILEAKRSLGLSISIPSATDDDLVELVPWLQGSLPMRLSPKHWTRWTLTKNRSSYRGRKIAPLSPR